MAFGSFDFANTSPLWDYADTMRWTHGKHSFSFAGEYRRPMTTGFNNSGYASATAGNSTGATTTAPLLSANITNFASELPGFNQTARNNAASLLFFQNGSIASALTSFWIDNYGDISKGF